MSNDPEEEKIDLEKVKAFSREDNSISIETTGLFDEETTYHDFEGR